MSVQFIEAVEANVFEIGVFFRALDDAGVHEDVYRAEIVDVFDPSVVVCYFLLELIA